MRPTEEVLSHITVETLDSFKESARSEADTFDAFFLRVTEAEAAVLRQYVEGVPEDVLAERYLVRFQGGMFRWRTLVLREGDAERVLVRWKWTLDGLTFRLHVEDGRPSEPAADSHTQEQAP